MAKIYGNRWEGIDGTLGQGGQARVFPVRDLSRVLSGAYALKRILNPNRQDRFRAEVEAITKLDHPNIVKLVDHSALDAEAGADKQFLVMKVAEEGDLSQSGRRKLYAGDIDATLTVALQVAGALDYAHSRGVIHRDIKPPNILCTGDGHEIWVSDFGICLIDGQDRATQDGEVVGPWQFMAPELERGGQLYVTPACDVYSLGKLIYFLVTNGVVIPREAIFEAEYKNRLMDGERQQLLFGLLAQMVCSLDSRIKTMAEVIDRLQAIKDWETRARVAALSPTVLEKLGRYKLAAQERRHNEDANAETAARERDRINVASANICDWLGEEFAKVAHALDDGSTISAKVEDAGSSGDWVANLGHGQGLFSHRRARLVLQKLGVTVAIEHCLDLHIATKSGAASFSSPRDGVSVPLMAERDHNLFLVPTYQSRPGGKAPVGPKTRFYLTQSAAIGGRYGRIVEGPGRRPTPQYFMAKWIEDQFGDTYSQGYMFKVSQWPSNVEILSGHVTDAVNVFVENILSA